MVRIKKIFPWWVEKIGEKLGLGLLDNIEPSSILTVLLSQNPKKGGGRTILAQICHLLEIEAGPC